MKKCQLSSPLQQGEMEPHENSPTRQIAEEHSYAMKHENNGHKVEQATNQTIKICLEDVLQSKEWIPKDSSNMTFVYASSMPFVCPVCRKRFLDIDALIRHCLNAYGSMCPHCSTQHYTNIHIREDTKSFNRMSQSCCITCHTHSGFFVLLNMLVDKEKGPFNEVWQFLNALHEMSKNLNSSSSDGHVILTRRCLICNQEMENDHEMMKHFEELMRHMEDCPMHQYYRYESDVCEMKQETNSMDNSTSKRTSSVLHSCPKCYKICKDRTELVQHCISMHGDSCLVCMSSKYTKKTHLKEKNKKVLKKALNCYITKMECCEMCHTHAGFYSLVDILVNRDNAPLKSIKNLKDTLCHSFYDMQKGNCIFCKEYENRNGGVMVHLENVLSHKRKCKTYRMKVSKPMKETEADLRKRERQLSTKTGTNTWQFVCPKCQTKCSNVEDLIFHCLGTHGIHCTHCQTSKYTNVSYKSDASDSTKQQDKMCDSWVSQLQCCVHCHTHAGFYALVNLLVQTEEIRSAPFVTIEDLYENLLRMGRRPTILNKSAVIHICIICKCQVTSLSEHLGFHVIHAKLCSYYKERSATLGLCTIDSSHNNWDQELIVKAKKHVQVAKVVMIARNKTYTQDHKAFDAKVQLDEMEKKQFNFFKKGESFVRESFLQRPNVFQRCSICMVPLPNRRAVVEHCLKTYGSSCPHCTSSKYTNTMALPHGECSRYIASKECCVICHRHAAFFLLYECFVDNQQLSVHDLLSELVDMGDGHQCVICNRQYKCDKNVFVHLYALIAHKKVCHLYEKRFSPKYVTLSYDHSYPPNKERQHSNGDASESSDLNVANRKIQVVTGMSKASHPESAEQSAIDRSMEPTSTSIAQERLSLLNESKSLPSSRGSDTESGRLHAMPCSSEPKADFAVLTTRRYHVYFSTWGKLMVPIEHDKPLHSEDVNEIHEAREKCIKVLTNKAPSIPSVNHRHHNEDMFMNLPNTDYIRQCLVKLFESGICAVEDHVTLAYNLEQIQSVDQAINQICVHEECLLGDYNGLCCKLEDGKWIFRFVVKKDKPQMNECRQRWIFDMDNNIATECAVCPFCGCMPDNLTFHVMLVHSNQCLCDNHQSFLLIQFMVAYEHLNGGGTEDIMVHIDSLEFVERLLEIAYLVHGSSRTCFKCPCCLTDFRSTLFLKCHLLQCAHYLIYCKKECYKSYAQSLAKSLGCPSNLECVIQAFYVKKLRKFFSDSLLGELLKEDDLKLDFFSATLITDPLTNQIDQEATSEPFEKKSSDQMANQILNSGGPNDNPMHKGIRDMEPAVPACTAGTSNTTQRKEPMKSKERVVHIGDAMRYDDLSDPCIAEMDIEGKNVRVRVSILYVLECADNALYKSNENRPLNIWGIKTRLNEYLPRFCKVNLLRSCQVSPSIHSFIITLPVAEWAFNEAEGHSYVIWPCTASSLNMYSENIPDAKNILVYSNTNYCDENDNGIMIKWVNGRFMMSFVRRTVDPMSQSHAKEGNYMPVFEGCRSKQSFTCCDVCGTFGNETFIQAHKMQDHHSSCLCAQHGPLWIFLVMHCLGIREGANFETRKITFLHCEFLDDLVYIMIQAMVQSSVCPFCKMNFRSKLLLTCHLLGCAHHMNQCNRSDTIQSQQTALTQRLNNKSDLDSIIKALRDVLSGKGMPLAVSYLEDLVWCSAGVGDLQQQVSVSFTDQNQVKLILFPQQNQVKIPVKKPTPVTIDTTTTGMSSEKVSQTTTGKFDLKYEELPECSEIKSVVEALDSITLERPLCLKPSNLKCSVDGGALGSTEYSVQIPWATNGTLPKRSNIMESKSTDSEKPNTPNDHYCDSLKVSMDTITAAKDFEVADRVCCSEKFDGILFTRDTAGKCNITLLRMETKEGNSLKNFVCMPVIKETKTKRIRVVTFCDLCGSDLIFNQTRNYHMEDYHPSSCLCENHGIFWWLLLMHSIETKEKQDDAYFVSCTNSSGFMEYLDDLVFIAMGHISFCPFCEINFKSELLLRCHLLGCAHHMGQCHRGEVVDSYHSRMLQKLKDRNILARCIELGKYVAKSRKQRNSLNLALIDTFLSISSDGEEIESSEDLPVVKDEVVDEKEVQFKSAKVDTFDLLKVEGDYSHDHWKGDNILDGELLTEEEIKSEIDMDWITYELDDELKEEPVDCEIKVECDTLA